VGAETNYGAPSRGIVASPALPDACNISTDPARQRLAAEKQPNGALSLGHVFPAPGLLSESCRACNRFFRWATKGPFFLCQLMRETPVLATDQARKIWMNLIQIPCLKAYLSLQVVFYTFIVTLHVTSTTPVRCYE
jgi:hypothetical protein